MWFTLTKLIRQMYNLRWENKQELRDKSSFKELK